MTRTSGVIARLKMPVEPIDMPFKNISYCPANDHLFRMNSISRRRAIGSDSLSATSFSMLSSLASSSSLSEPLVSSPDCSSSALSSFPKLGASSSERQGAVSALASALALVVRGE